CDEVREMRPEIWFGMAGGIIASLMSWSGNQTPHFVSIFPDGMTVLVLISYFMGVVRVQRRQAATTDLRSTVHRLWPAAATCGLMMGVSQILLGFARFDNPDWRILSFGFVGALVGCLVDGTFAATAAWAVHSYSSGRTA